MSKNVTTWQIWRAKKNPWITHRQGTLPHSLSSFHDMDVLSPTSGEHEVIHSTHYVPWWAWLTDKHAFEMPWDFKAQISARRTCFFKKIVPLRVNGFESTRNILCQPGVLKEPGEGRGLTTKGNSFLTAFANHASDSNHYLWIKKKNSSFPCFPVPLSCYFRRKTVRTPVYLSHVASATNHSHQYNHIPFLFLSCQSLRDFFCSNAFLFSF